MKQATQRNRSEEAVSPVVGVMLMLVVTIIIAAVVSSFAGGLATSTEKAPNAVLDVKIEANHSMSMTADSKYTYPLMTIEYITGDTKLDTNKMGISTSWKGTDGKLYTYTYNGSTWDNNGHQNASIYYPLTNWDKRMPINTECWFGNYTLLPGENLVSAGQWVATYGVDLPINNDKSWEQIFGSGYDKITKGTDVRITISYDNYVLLDKVVTVQ